MTKAELNALYNVKISSCKAEELVDIRSVRTDKTKPVEERVAEFIEAVKNPYLFKVDDVIVKINCAPGGKSFGDAVADMLISG